MTTEQQTAARLASELGLLWDPARVTSADVDLADVDLDELAAEADEEDEATTYAWLDHIQGRTCDTTGCELAPRYKLTPWRAGGSGVITVVHGTEIGLDGPDAGETFTFGEKPADIIGGIRKACGTRHAFELAQALRTQYNRFGGPDHGPTYVRIERWTYTPNHLELPESLFDLREAGRMVAAAATGLADQRNDYLGGRPRNAGRELAAARAYAARLVAILASLDAHDQHPVAYHDSIPADVDTVRTAADGGQVFDRSLAGTGWYAGTTSGRVEFATDADLLAAHSPVWGFPQSVLVTPEDLDITAGVEA